MDQHVIEVSLDQPRTARGLLLSGLVASRAVSRMRLLSVRPAPPHSRTAHLSCDGPRARPHAIG